MPVFITDLQQKISSFWKGLDKSQKTRIYLTAAILVIALVVSIFLLTRTTYVPLITSSDSKEVSEMAAILEDNGFKYEISGDTILIDSKNKNKAQALLVQNDYPKSTESIFADAFNKIKLSTTESDKRKLFEEAQERTIAAKLKMLDNIEDASVDLAIPEPSVFLFSEDDVVKPTASVMIKPRKQLTKEQVKAVVMWVSRCVEDLDPENITVVDYDLNELTGYDTDDLSSTVSSQYEMKRLWSEDLEKSVKKLFAGQFESFDAITVVANPILDFDSSKTNKKILSNPEGMDGAAVISSEKSTTKVVNGTQEGGIPGMETNPGTEAPTYQYDNGEGENSTYDEKHEIINYGYNETLTEEEKAVGQMVPEKSTMAINLLYGNRATDEDKINEEIEKVKEIASSATGIPLENITVNKFKIAQEAPIEQRISDRVQDFFNTYGPLVLVLLLTIILMIAVLPRRKRSEEPMETEVAAVPAFTLPEQTTYVPEINLEEKSEIKKQIDKFIKQKPEAVAQLLRNWLSEDWN